MNEVLEQLPEIMEGDAFSLTNATRDEDETGKKDERDDVPPHVTTEVDTTKVVKTPEMAEGVEVEIDRTEVMAVESSEKSGSEQASEEEELPLEEAPDIAQTEVEKTEDNTKVEKTEDNTKVETSAITGKNDEGKDAEEGTAYQAGPPDGGVTL